MAQFEVGMTRLGTSKRPKVVAPPERVKRLSALLCQELLQWPDVKVRAMFGMRAVYRHKVVFAMLPDKRAMENPNAIAYKRPDRHKGQDGRNWHLFELESDRDVRSALALLHKAYTTAVESQPEVRKKH